MGFAGRFSRHPYLEQYDRIKRWHSILKASDFSGDLTHHVDIIYAFFQSCYHLRDWLVNSRAVDRQKVDDFVSNSKEMKICRDVCNTSKHLVLVKPSIGNDPTIYGDEVALVREYDPLNNYNLFILVDFEKSNILELAKKCIDLWTTFMKDNGLL